MRFWGLLAMGLVMASAATAEPLRIYAAGSLAKALPPLIAAAGLGEGAVAAPVFGPAGALGERLLNGEDADLFASADLAKPRALVAKRGGFVVAFARNRMCVAAPKALGLTNENLLDRWLSPSFRLATSTPVVDPGGDYALAIFAKAELVKPGSGKTLADKAMHLLGAPGTMALKDGHSAAANIFLEKRSRRRIDLLLQRRRRSRRRSPRPRLNAAARRARRSADLWSRRALRPPGRDEAGVVHAI